MTKGVDLTSMPAISAAEAWLGLLKARGIEYLFANAGTDFPSIIEGMARAPKSGLAFPEAIAVPHENAAVCMAYGHTMVSGRPQAVMVHVNVGTANALCGLLNASRENIPMLFASGRTPVTESGMTGSRDVSIHWGQEMRDQAGMLREVVKWDYELRYPSQIEDLIDRALALTMSDPQGPVYMSLPREVLAEPVDGFEYQQPSAIRPSAPAAPDLHAIDAAANILSRAEFPLIITSRLGRDPTSFRALSEFSDRFAIPVVEYRMSAHSLPSDHPMHAGYEPGAHFEMADAILVLDTPAPWVPDRARPRAGTPVIHMGPDPQFSALPARGFPVSEAIPCSIPAGLSQLGAALADQIGRNVGGIAQRHQALSEKFAAERAKRRRKLAAPGGTPISQGWASHCLNQIKDPDAIIVNEIGCAPPVMTFDEPGCYFGPSNAGGLGWGLPAALGAKLAAPDRLVIATVGDGSHMFANPVACHQVSAAHNIPILTIVFNNRCWRAVKTATQSIYPEGEATAANEMPLTGLEPSPSFEKISEACDGYGEKIDDPDDLPAALERAIKVVKEEGRQALLNVQTAM